VGGQTLGTAEAGATPIAGRFGGNSPISVNCGMTH